MTNIERGMENAFSSYTPSELCGSALLASLDRIVEQIVAATVKSAPPTHPSHLGCVVMIQPPSTGPMIRVILSIEVMAPKTPPRRLGGAACAMMLVNDGREMLWPNEKRIATKISFHQTSTAAR